MTTNVTSSVAVRRRTALVESVLGHTVDWAGLPDPNGFIEEVLGIAYDQPSDLRLVSAHLLGHNASYYRHSEQTAASLLDLVRTHSENGRVAGPMISWTPGTAFGGVESGAGGEPVVYRVLGWTSTAILRGTLSRRLDSLNPVAAFRLLEQPEIALLDRCNRDYVALRCPPGRRDQSSDPSARAIWAHDIDLWHTTSTGELEGVFAIDLDTYRNRFAETGVAN